MEPRDCDLIGSNSYRTARAKSVNRTIEQEEERRNEYTKRAYREGRRDGFTAGAKKGLKRGFISAAIVTILLCSGFSMAKNAINDAFIKDYSNPSATSGYQIAASATHRTADNQNYWYDYYDIARSYDAETMDFDAFVYGNYRYVGWNQESKLECMDELFHQFYSVGITDFYSFVAYCEDKGVCKEVDGKLQVDSKAYEQAIKDYLYSLNEVQSLNDHIDEFKHGM